MKNLKKHSKTAISIVLLSSLVFGVLFVASNTFTSVGTTAMIISQKAQDVIEQEAIQKVREHYRVAHSEPTPFLIAEKNDRSIKLFGKTIERYTLTIWDFKDSENIPVREIVVPKDIYDAYNTTNIIELYDDEETLLYNDVATPALLKVVFKADSVTKN